MKRSFILISSIIIVLLLSLYSLTILKNNTLFSNINTHKYLHLQGRIHMEKLKNFINTHNDTQINNFSLNDNRYNMKIVKTITESSVLYHVSLETYDDTNVRIYETFVK
jgi:hypothetical protein